MRILLTGSQGFIGHHFYNYLKNKGHDVWGIDLIDNGWKQKWIQLDLRKKIPLDIGFDMIFHLASDVGGINYLKNKGKTIARNNEKIDFNVVHYAKNHCDKLIYFSSSCVYDGNEYGNEKLFGEELVRNNGVNYLIVRPQNVYGTEDYKSGEREQVISALFRQAKNRHIKLLGHPDDKRSFIWTKDLFDLIMKNLDKTKTIDAGGQWITIGELAQKISSLYPGEFLITYNKNAKLGKPKRFIKFDISNVCMQKRLREIYKCIK